MMVFLHFLYGFRVASLWNGFVGGSFAKVSTVSDTRFFYTWLVFDRPDIVDFWDLGGSRARKQFHKVGSETTDVFEWFPGPQGLPGPTNQRSLIGQKPCIE